MICDVEPVCIICQSKQHAHQQTLLIPGSQADGYRIHQAVDPLLKTFFGVLGAKVCPFEEVGVFLRRDSFFPNRDGRCMVFQIRFKLRCPFPVADAPVFKAPFVHVLIALVIYVPDQPVPYYEIGGKIIDVQSSSLRLGRNVSYLGKIRCHGRSVFDLFKDGGPFNVFLHDALGLWVDSEHLRHADACCLQAFIIPLFRFDFVAEGIIIARFMVDLLHHYLLPVTLRQVGISALAVAQQPEDAIGFPADIQLFRHAFLLFHFISPEIRVKEIFPFA